MTRRDGAILLLIVAAWVALVIFVLVVNPFPTPEAYR